MNGSRAGETVRSRPSNGLFVVLAVMVPLCAAAQIIHWHVTSQQYMPDDAFISFRYAENVARGLGPVWNSGERVEGYSNFGWVMILAAIDLLGLDIVDVAPWAGFALAMGIFFVLPSLCASIRPADSTYTMRMTLLSMLLLGLNGGFALWTFAGLEVPLLAFLLTIGVVLLVQEAARNTSMRSSAVVFATLAVVRADAMIFGLAAGALLGCNISSPTHRGPVVRWMSVFFGIVGAYWIWRSLYYEALFPNTYYLKAGDLNHNLLLRGSEYALGFVLSYWLWIGLLALLVFRRERPSATHPVVVMACFVVVWIGYNVTNGGDWMPYYRYLMPILPLCVILVSCGILEIASQYRSALPHRSAVLVSTALVFLTAAAAIRPITDRAARNPASFRSETDAPGRVRQDEQRMIGEWLRENTPEGALVAFGAGGALPYYSKVRAADISGVNDRHIAHLDMPTGTGFPGHEKYDGPYIVSLEPTLIVFWRFLEEKPRLTESDYADSEVILPHLRSIVNTDGFWELYRPVAVKFDDKWLNVLERRENESYP